MPDNEFSEVVRARKSDSENKLKILQEKLLLARTQTNNIIRKIIIFERIERRSRFKINPSWENIAQFIKKLDGQAIDGIELEITPETESQKQHILLIKGGLDGYTLTAWIPDKEFYLQYHNLQKGPIVRFDPTRLVKLNDSESEHEWLVETDLNKILNIAHYFAQFGDLLYESNWAVAGEANMTYIDEDENDDTDSPTVQDVLGEYYDD